MRATVVALALMAAVGPASAASMGIISFAGSTPIISLAGPIALGDEVKFGDFAQALRGPAIVRLSSGGGNTLAALAIGREIARLGYTTAVGDGEICASACGLIWLAGRQRISGPASQVGLHATYLQQDGKSVETSPGNALVGKYLGELGYSDEFVVYATSAAPNEMSWLNRDITDRFGVAWEMRLQDVATLNTLDIPAQAAAVQPLAPLPAIAAPSAPQARPAPVASTPFPEPKRVPTEIVRPDGSKVNSDAEKQRFIDKALQNTEPPLDLEPSVERKPRPRPAPRPSKTVERPRTLADDVTEFFLGDPRQQPAQRAVTRRPAGATTPTE